MSRTSQRSFDTGHHSHSHIQQQSVFGPREVRVPDAPPAVPGYQTVEELLQSFGPQQPHQLNEYQPFTGEQEQDARAAHHAFQNQHHLTWVSQAPASSSTVQGNGMVAPSLFRTQSHQPGPSGASLSSNLEVASAPMQRAYSSPANSVAAQTATAAAATTTVSLGDGIIVAGRHYPVSNAADLLAGLVANSSSSSTNATPAPSTAATPAPTHASGSSRRNENHAHHQMQLQPPQQVLAYEVRPEDLVQYVMLDPATGMIVDWDASAHGVYPQEDVYAGAAGGHAGEVGSGRPQQQQAHERSKKEHIPSFGSWIHASPLPTPDSADTNRTLVDGPSSASQPQFTYQHQQHLVPIRSTSGEHAQMQMQDLQMDGMLSATSMVNWPPTAAGSAYPHGQQRHLPDTPTLYITESEHGRQAHQHKESDEPETSAEAANLTIIEHDVDEDEGEEYEDDSCDRGDGQDERHGGNTSMQSIGSIKSGDGISQYLHC